jgi:hypothetical protein
LVTTDIKRVYGFGQANSSLIQKWSKSTSTRK